MYRRIQFQEITLWGGAPFRNSKPVATSEFQLQILTQGLTVRLSWYGYYDYVRLRGIKCYQEYIIVTRPKKGRVFSTTATKASTLQVGLCQLNAQKDKVKNLIKAGDMVREASEKGADIIMLPEMFNCPFTK